MTKRKAKAVIELTKLDSCDHDQLKHALCHGALITFEGLQVSPEPKPRKSNFSLLISAQVNAAFGAAPPRKTWPIGPRDLYYNFPEHALYAYGHEMVYSPSNKWVKTVQHLFVKQGGAWHDRGLQHDLTSYGEEPDFGVLELDTLRIALYWHNWSSWAGLARL